MGITRYTLRGPTYPLSGLAGLPNRLGRLFEDGECCDDGCCDDVGYRPPVSMTVTDDSVVVTAELPGLDRAEVKLRLEADVLTIEGEKKHAVEVEGGANGSDVTYALSERRYGNFRRSFNLPSPVSAEDASARFDNGVLTVRLPKANEARSRRIEIEA